MNKKHIIPAFLLVAICLFTATLSSQQITEPSVELLASYDRVELSQSEQVYWTNIMVPPTVDFDRQLRVELVFEDPGVHVDTDWSYLLNYTVGGDSYQLELRRSSSNDKYKDVRIHPIGHYLPTIRTEQCLNLSCETGVVPAGVRVDIYLEEIYYRDFDGDEQVNVVFNPVNSSIEWTQDFRAFEYDVEWVFVDALSTDVHGNQLNYTTGEIAFQQKKGVRVTTSQTSYQLDLTYPQGDLWVRVRPVGRYNEGVDGDYSHRKEGAWSYAEKYTIATSFEDDKNWSYARSFGEEGKSKQVISYYSGDLRSRQSITHLNSLDLNVVGEAKYDFEGRASVSLLPAPSEQEGLNYIDNFNQNTSGDPFEREDFDKGISSKMGTGSGAAQYFSSANPFSNDPYRDYIPDMEGMAYGQTKYMRDGSGRVASVGGVGEQHKLGSGHETRYFYGTPSQTELHRLFGKDVGDASHYQKMWVMDANGVISTSISNQEGQVIATSLVGDAPSNMVELAGWSPEDVTISLLGNNEYDAQANQMVAINELINVTPNSVYQFNYQSNGNLFQIGTTDPALGSVTGICRECEYDLEIFILDPDGEVVELSVIDGEGENQTITPEDRILRHYPEASTGDPSCSEEMTYDNEGEVFEVTFEDLGTYTIVKRLKLSTASLDSQLEEALEHAGLGEADLEQLLEEVELSEEDKNQCHYTCSDYFDQECKTEALQAGIEGSAEYEAAYESCILTKCGALEGALIEEVLSNNCEAMYQQMLMDVSPASESFDGYYFEQEASSDFWSRVSVDLNGGVAVFHDEQGAEMSSQPSLSTVRDANNWQPQWADDLVHYHPEICHYHACDNSINQESKLYDLEMADALGWSEGSTSGHLDPQGQSLVSTSTVHLDPYQSESLKEDLEVYQDGKNLWDYIHWEFSISNDHSTEYNDALGGFSSAEINQIKWETFRFRYQQLKSQDQLGDDCPYLDDDQAVVIEPELPEGEQEMEEFISTHQYFESICVGTCEGNVAVWLSELQAVCGLYGTPVQMNNLRDGLLEYCSANCGLSNPDGIILSSAISGNIESLLGARTGGYPSPLDSDLGCLSSTIGQADNYYTYQDGGASTVTHISGCFYSLIEHLNDEAFPVYSTVSATVSIDNTVETGMLGSCIGEGDEFRLYGTNAGDNFTTLYYLSSDDNGGTCATSFEIRGYYHNPVEGWERLDFTQVKRIYDVSYDATTGVADREGLEYQSIKAKAELDNGMIIEFGFYATGDRCFPFDFIKTSSYTAVIGINTEWDQVEVSLSELEQECKNSLLEEARAEVVSNFVRDVSEFKSTFLQEFYDFKKCLPTAEKWSCTYEDKEHHFMLYKYAQGGLLEQTIPPAGVDRMDVDAAHGFDTEGNYTWVSSNHDPDHDLETDYRYNSFGQITYQHTPDGGGTWFYYNDAGQVRYSVTEQQKEEGRFSYVKYDGLGRIIEAGESDQKVTVARNIGGMPTDVDYLLYDPALTAVELEAIEADMSFPDQLANTYEVSKTYFDEAIIVPVGFVADNLRNRVSSVAYYDKGDQPYDHAYHYSYDQMGNVKELAQEIAALSHLGESLKRLQYQYDLTGQVHQVTYQPGGRDQLMHRYEYDDDGRLTGVKTSQKGVVWHNDAEYFYYMHGPKVRTELGDQKVQGVDYAYTQMGWIKGVNSNNLKFQNDIGKDGWLSGNNAHERIARDVFGFSLHYYKGDYKSISSRDKKKDFVGEAYSGQFPTSGVGAGLYNGNIAQMATAIYSPTAQGDLEVDARLMGYSHDVLNRLKVSQTHGTLASLSPNMWQPATTAKQQEYKVEVSHDGNGNILTLDRYESTGSLMDDLSYFYDTEENNQLHHVEDQVSAGSFPNIADFESHGTYNANAHNYEYDLEGNLKVDKGEGIEEIVWMNSGKVRAVIKRKFIDQNGDDQYDVGEPLSGGVDLEFEYDPAGNRVVKIVKPHNTSGTPGLQSQTEWVYTYYSRDASGNIMATYDRRLDLNGGVASDELLVSEQHLYGSDRLGMIRDVATVQKATYSAQLSGGMIESTGAVTLEVTEPSVSEQREESANYSQRTFHLSNHLGNVLTTISDRKFSEKEDQSSFTSGFEGGDYMLFSSGDYSSLQVVDPGDEDNQVVRLEYPTNQYGPSIKQLVGQGDVISASIKARLEAVGTAGTVLTLSLVDGEGDAYYTYVDQSDASNNIKAWASSNALSDNQINWEELELSSYSVPVSLYKSNGDAVDWDNDPVYVMIYPWVVSSSNPTLVDDLEVDVDWVDDRIYYVADIQGSQSYYPFGMKTPGQGINMDYRLGFQNQETEDELWGGSSSFFKYRISDNRLGKFFSVDPLAPKYPYNSPYAFSENSLIAFVELEGLEKVAPDEIWDIGVEQKFATASDIGSVYFQEGMKVTKIKGTLVTLHEIQSGPNAGNWLGIAHYGGSYTNFFAFSDKPAESGYTYEYRFIVGADRVPVAAFTNDIGGGVATGDAFVALFTDAEYSSDLNWVGRVYWYGTGYFDNNGEYHHTKTLGDAYGEVITNPYVWVGAARGMVMAPHPGNYVEVKSVGAMARNGARIPKASSVRSTGAPASYLDKALNRQGLNKAGAGLKESWVEGGYKYEVRVHPADPKYGKSGNVYRVGRSKQGTDAKGQGYGWEYMDTQGNWHHTSTLKPGKGGNVNPKYNAQAAKDTHISVPKT